jgi:hypothetical protein
MTRTSLRNLASLAGLAVTTAAEAAAEGETTAAGVSTVHGLDHKVAIALFVGLALSLIPLYL